MPIGLSEVVSGVAEGRRLMNETQQMHNRRVKIVDVDLLVGEVEITAIGHTVPEVEFHATASEPYRERVWKVIAAIRPLQGGDAARV